MSCLVRSQTPSNLYLKQIWVHTFDTCVIFHFSYERHTLKKLAFGYKSDQKGWLAQVVSYPSYEQEAWDTNELPAWGPWARPFTLMPSLERGGLVIRTLSSSMLIFFLINTHG